MNILKRGTKLEEKYMSGECRECLSLVEFQLKEATATSDGRNGTNYSIICPICKSQMFGNGTIYEFSKVLSSPYER